MRLVTFAPRHGPSGPGEPTHGMPRLGALAEGAVIDLAAALADEVPGGIPSTMMELLVAGAEGMALARRALEAGRRARPAGALYEAEAVQLLAPLPAPGKILGVGRNYGAHAVEGGLGAQEKPRIFVKLSSSVIGPGAPIRRPAAVEKLDYETELAVVIGRPTRDVREEEALACVAGYTILNDVSARELQFDVNPPQTSFAKSMDGFCPMGPCLATPDEFADVGNIRLYAWVNGELAQEASTREMIFPVPYLIAYLSAYMLLGPGDVIATGTPAGVGAFRKPPRFLAPGDRLRMEVPEIGVLENDVV